MTTFRFIHAADLHLGSPLKGLAARDGDLAERLAKASRDALKDLVSRAIEIQVAFMVIAGDIYDGEWKDTSVGLFFAAEMARMSRTGIPVFVVKGNHDAESVVTKSITLPTSVTVFGSERAETVRIDQLEVALHGRSFPDRAVEENFALGYPPPLPGSFNIGVLHTSLNGREGHATYAPCTPSDLARAGYDYWALGHIHAHEVVGQDPWIVYPGNLQGRSIREPGAKGAVLVSVEHGRVVALDRLVVDRARFAEVLVDLTGVETEEHAIERIGAALSGPACDARDRLLVARIRLVGETALHDRLVAERARLADEARAALDRAHDDAWLERLKIETTPPMAHRAARVDDDVDFAALMAGLEADPSLRAAAEADLAAICAKLPAQVAGAPGIADIDGLLDEARALVLDRIRASEA